MKWKFGLLIKSFLFILILYLILIPVVYIYNIYQSTWIYIVANIVRFLSVALFAVLLRRKYSAKLLSEQNILFQLFLVGGLVLSIILNLMEIPSTIFMRIMLSFNIYEFFGENLFLSVLFEELFDNYFIFNLLLCLGIIFIKPHRKKDKIKL